MIDLVGGYLEIYFTDTKGTNRSLAEVLGIATTKEAQYTNYVESARIKQSWASFTEIEIQLTPIFEDAVKLIKSGLLGIGFSPKVQTGQKSNANADPETATESGLEVGLNTVSVRLHYGEQKPSQWFRGMLTMPELSIGPDNISITLKAVGLNFEKTKTSKQEVVSDKSRWDTVSRIMTGPNMNIEVDPRDFRAKEFLDKAESMNLVKTDWFHVKEILDKSGCILIDHGATSPGAPTTLKVISREYMRQPRATDPTFVLWGQIDPQGNRYPILSMQTSLNNVLFGLTFGLNSNTIDTATKESSTKPKADPSKMSKNVNTRDGSTGGTSDQPVKTYMGLDKDAVNGFIQQAIDSPLQYEVTTVGIPGLYPGRRVNIEVADVKMLSGGYDLKEVEHSIGGDGVVTKLALCATAGLVGLGKTGMEYVASKVSTIPISQREKSPTDIGASQ